MRRVIPSLPHTSSWRAKGLLQLLNAVKCGVTHSRGYDNELVTSLVLLAQGV
jgi:hypothetical protein